MPRYGNFMDAARSGELYSCNCVGGVCSNCGECCTDLLPLTPDELRTLKEYAHAHGLREHRQAPFWDQHAIDMTCPFRNQQTQRCDAYPARPEICRSFICSKPKAEAYRDRDAVAETRQHYSLRWEIFGNDEVISSPVGRVLAQEREQEET